MASDSPDQLSCSIENCGEHRGGGGGTGGGTPPPSSGSNTGGLPPMGGETLGFPNWFPFPQGSIWRALLPIDPSCEFGPCVSIGNGYAVWVWTGNATWWQRVKGWASKKYWEFWPKKVEGNLCRVGDTRVATVSLPNVYNGTISWEEAQRQGVHACEARAPSSYTSCTHSPYSPNGPVVYCDCCVAPGGK